MIRNFIRNIIHRIRSGPDEKPVEIIQRLSKKTAPRPDGQNSMSETLFWLDKIKNSRTVNTGEHEALTSLFTGQKMYVDTRDISVAPHLMLDGNWEPTITKVFQKVVKPGDTVIDLGANFAYFALVAGSVLQEEPKTSQLLIVEANPVLIPYINKSLAVNGLLEMTEVVNKGVADKKGTIELKMLKDDWGSSTAQSIQDFEKRRKTNYEVERVIKVESDSLDGICKTAGITAADVVKIDIEGFEEISYPGMKNLIKNSPNLKMLLEFTLQGYKAPKKFYDKLSSDFKYIYAITDEDYLLTKIDNYDQLVEIADNDWVMLLLSKEETI